MNFIGYYQFKQLFIYYGKCLLVLKCALGNGWQRQNNEYIMTFWILYPCYRKLHILIEVKPGVYLHGNHAMIHWRGTPMVIEEEVNFIKCMLFVDSNIKIICIMRGIDCDKRFSLAFICLGIEIEWQVACRKLVWQSPVSHQRQQLAATK